MAHSATALLAVSLLVGLTAACAPSGRTSQGAADLSPQRDTTVGLGDRPFAPATVTSETIDRAPRQSVEEILEGRVSGVAVLRTPDGIVVRIRGFTSFLSSNDPLYVLDGIPIQAGPGGSLRGISPYDIESIKVLKDPAETAIYGMRGANGVVLITTKRS